MPQAEPLTLRDVLLSSLNQYKDNVAFSFTDDLPVSYSAMQSTIQGLQDFFLKNGLQKGDRVALLGQNMPNWALSYFAVTSYGAVVVPILPDFSIGEISNILLHSGVKAIIVSQRLMSRLDAELFPSLPLRILMDDLQILSSTGYTTRSGKIEASEKPSLPALSEDDLAAIIYTSGTTGRSKGVMLTHKNLVSNARQVLTIQYVIAADIFLSVLPLSHTYENTLGMILPVMQGASVYYLKKPPTSSVLLPALGEIRPTVMLTVPMIIEKVYRSQVLVNFLGSLFKKIIYAFPPTVS